MSAKRQATSNLNHDNWDQEEEPEERGIFPTASEDELNKRVIKKARRKIPETTDAADGGSANKSIFSGFTGFGKPSSAPTTSAASPFSFLSKLPIATTTNVSDQATSIASATKPTFSFGSGNSVTTTAANSEANKTTAVTAKVLTGTEDHSTYYAKLKGLNQAVSDWIKTHVDKSPLCILTPIFKDYEKYLEEIQAERKKPSDSTATATDKDNDAKQQLKSNTTTFSNFKFSASTSSNTTSAETKTVTSSIFGTAGKPTEIPKKNGFSFGVKSYDKPDLFAPVSSTSIKTASFSFDNPSIPKNSNVAENKTSTGFSFTRGAAPFSFANIKPPATLSTENDEEPDEDDQPPKVEFKQVVEDDAIFSKKCKVFVKKNESFTDRGVGTLYLKPVKDSEKTQLLVRADTNLGNILVNLILSAAIPAQRMGKNNVMLVCLALPEAEKPAPMLLRVKTSEEADELLEIIEKYKK